MAITDPRREEHASVSLHASGIGEELREARERRGLALEEAAEATCILPRYLRALEEGAPIDAFPAPVYARFFLREYARFLGVDDGPLVSRFDQEHGGELEPHLRAIPVPEEEPRRRGGLLVLLSGLVLAALVVASLLSGRPPAPRALPTASRSPAAAEARERGEPEPAPPAVRSIRFVLRAEAPSWVHVVADGRILASETLQAGQAIRTPRRVQVVGVRLGNPEAVTITVNGRTVDLAPLTERLGQPYEVVWRVEDGELHRRAGEDLGVLRGEISP
ncbi:MAG TPA: RodZ domain-containing protein [Actinomycetota bacterium]|nr:RodZ domain-containing protein [Actinomycetota bacterium]